MRALKTGLGFLLMACAVDAHADPETFVSVSCERERGELRIEESHEDKDITYPIDIGPEDMTFPVTGLVSAQEVSGHIVQEDRPISRECRLGADLYVVTIRAYSASPSIQGHCGGNPPSASITLSRNGEPILSNLVLDEGCEAAQLIASLRILNNPGVLIAAVVGKSAGADPEPRYARVPIRGQITTETIRSAAARDVP